MSIYVLRYGGLVKIGFSADLPSRVRSIMASIPGDVAFVGHMPGERDVEQHLHGRFEVERFSGEWFAESERIKAFCSAALTQEFPAQIDRRTSGNKRKRDYPDYALAIRDAARGLWPETDHKQRVAHMAETLGLTLSRVKKLYYAEGPEPTAPEADRLRAIAAEIEAKRASK